MSDQLNETRKDIAKNPSDIAKCALGYLDSMRGSAKQKELTEEIFYLFVSSLKSNPTSKIRETATDYAVCSNWRDYDPGIISEFLDWWFPAKVLGSADLRKRAPAILRKWVTWCFNHQYIHENQYKGLLAELPRSKTQDIARLEKASDILYRLHSPEPGAWRKGIKAKIASIQSRSKADRYVEGYMKVAKLGAETCALEDSEGNKVRPVLIGKDLANILQVGDVMNVELGHYGKSWKVIESGNVYGEGAVF